MTTCPAGTMTKQSATYEVPLACPNSLLKSSLSLSKTSELAFWTFESTAPITRTLPRRGRGVVPVVVHTFSALESKPARLSLIRVDSVGGVLAHPVSVIESATITAAGMHFLSSLPEPKMGFNLRTHLDY